MRALAEGKIDTFMGFKFKIVKRLPLVGGVRTCVAFQKGAMQATRYMKPTSLTVRDDLRNSLQIYDTGLIGAARLQDEGVVQIDVAEMGLAAYAQSHWNENRLLSPEAFFNKAQAELNGQIKLSDALIDFHEQGRQAAREKKDFDAILGSWIGRTFSRGWLKGQPSFPENSAGPVERATGGAQWRASEAAGCDLAKCGAEAGAACESVPVFEAG